MLIFKLEQKEIYKKRQENKRKEEKEEKKENKKMAERKKIKFQRNAVYFLKIYSSFSKHLTVVIKILTCHLVAPFLPWYYQGNSNINLNLSQIPLFYYF